MSGFLATGPGVVTFNYNEWLTIYPEFSGTSQPVAQTYFNRACLYCDNSACSPIQDLTQRAFLLNMATAHIAKLFALNSANQPANPLVGRVADATQGSVSVSTVYMEPTSDLQAWFGQTQYGAAFWAATSQFRTGFFVPPMRRGRWGGYGAPLNPFLAS